MNIETNKRYVVEMKLLLIYNFISSIVISQKNIQRMLYDTIKQHSEVFMIQYNFLIFYVMSIIDVFFVIALLFYNNCSTDWGLKLCIQLNISQQHTTFNHNLKLD